MGIKERRTKLLLTIILFSDFSGSSLQTSFTPFTLSDKIQQAVDLSLNQKTRGTIAGLLKEGEIEKTEEENTYRLTTKGFYSISLKFPFFRFLIDRWDGVWRVLSYEIPEKKRDLRDRLRREVAGWGLGPWHRSFWITPHPIIENLKELVSQKEEEQYIQAFEAKHVFGDREVLIEKVWQKKSLDSSYRALFKKWHEILSTEIDKVEKLKKVISEYINVLRIDPGLPKELVGEKWIGFESHSIFKEIRGILLS